MKRAADYDYLLSMPLWSLTMEKVEQLKKERRAKEAELEVMEATAPVVSLGNLAILISRRRRFLTARLCVNTGDVGARSRQLRGRPRRLREARGRGDEEGQSLQSQGAACCKFWQCNSTCAAK